MKTKISIPDSLFEEAEALVQELAISRSELYTKALKVYLRNHNHNQMQNQINAIYSVISSELDPILAEMQWRSLPNEKW